MRPCSTTVAELLQSTEDPPNIQAETKRISEILDAKYEPADLEQVAQDTPLLSKDDRKDLFKLLKKYSILFYGQLVKYTCPLHTTYLKDGVTPYHGKPYKYLKCMKLNSRQRQSDWLT